MIAGIIFTVTGLVLIIISWFVLKKQMISLFHSYHVDKVSDENKPAFCRLAGMGLLITGISMIISGILMALTEKPVYLLIFAAGFIIGIYMMFSAEKKYNK